MKSNGAKLLGCVFALSLSSLIGCSGSASETPWPEHPEGTDTYNPVGEATAAQDDALAAQKAAEQAKALAAAKERLKEMRHQPLEWDENGDPK